MLLRGIQEGTLSGAHYCNSNDFSPKTMFTQSVTGSRTTDLTRLGDYFEEEASANFDEPLSMDYARNVVAVSFTTGPSDDGM